MMKLQRVRNAGRNIAYGALLKVLQIVVPFLIRTAMIYYLGLEYVGLNGLFTAILQVINLAELGVGSAMVFSMYKPIAEDDPNAICALMRLYRTYYRIIGLVVLVAGLFLLPFLPVLVKDELPDNLNLYILYLLNLGATVLSYWLFAYKNCIFTAYQRNDITSKVGIAIFMIQYVLEYIAIVHFHSYYIFLIVKLITQVLMNVTTAHLAQRYYPQYTPRGEMAPEIVKGINQKIRDLFTGKLGGVIVNSADTIVISAFLGINALAIYNNYYYILTSIISFFYIIFSACLAGIGNSIVTESCEKNYQDFRVFSLIIGWIAGFCTCCLLCLYQPFMRLWIKREDAMFSMKEVCCLCAYFFVYELVSMMIQYKDAAGIWHEDRFRPLLTAVSNLILNIISVQYFGIVGVLMSTVITFVGIGIPWLIRNIFKLLFHISPMAYVKKICFYSAVTACVCALCYVICDMLPFTGFAELICRGVVCTLVSNTVFFLVYKHEQEFDGAKKIILKILKRV